MIIDLLFVIFLKVACSLGAADGIGEWLYPIFTYKIRLSRLSEMPRPSFKSLSQRQGKVFY